LLCYNFVNGVTYEKENVLLATKLDLFVISTIILPKSKILVVVVVDAKINTDTKIDINTKINIEDLIFDFPYTLREISLNIMLTQIKTHEECKVESIKRGPNSPLKFGY